MDIAQEQRNGDDFVAVSDEEDVEYELEGDQSSQRVISNVDSAGNEIKHSVDRDSSAGKLFVGGVSWETTEETFTKHFMKYGEITDSVIMKEKHTKRPRGFGFVTFADPSVVDMVLEDEHVINGRMVEVKRTVPREDMQDKGVPKTKKIFVGGIPPTLTEDELKEYFSSYGNIVEHQIMLDHSTGRSRGFGFITFESEDSVMDIFSEGKVHELRGKQVEIKKAEPKRGGVDQVSDFRSGYGGGYRSGGGGAARSYGGFGSGYGGGYRSGGGYSGRTGGGYGGYGGYAESYGIGPASVYGGYGGYGYGYGMYGAGFGGSIYGPSGYGGDGYDSTGAYGGAYGGGGNKGYGNVNAANGRYHPYGRRTESLQGLAAFH